LRFSLTGQDEKVGCVTGAVPAPWSRAGTGPTFGDRPWRTSPTRRTRKG
jgi:hypothetical protein